VHRGLDGGIDRAGSGTGGSRRRAGFRRAPVRFEHGDALNSEGASREKRGGSAGRGERSGMSFCRGREEWKRAPRGGKGAPAA
jgi:hypothetical protein